MHVYNYISPDVLQYILLLLFAIWKFCYDSLDKNLTIFIKIK